MIFNYLLLDVSRTAYFDIRCRLEKAGILKKYLKHQPKQKEILDFGNFGLCIQTDFDEGDYIKQLYDKYKENGLIKD